MIDLILTIIPGEWLAGLGALLAAFLGVWITGRRSGAVRAEKRGLQDEVKGHEVRNEIEAGIDLRSDARKRLHERWSK